MSLPSKVRIPDGVMARPVAEEVVILDLASGNYFGLDPVGARIWQSFVEGKAPSETHRLLLDEYDVGAEALEADIERLIGELQEKGLLLVEIS